MDLVTTDFDGSEGQSFVGVEDKGCYVKNLAKFLRDFAEYAQQMIARHHLAQ